MYQEAGFPGSRGKGGRAVSGDRDTGTTSHSDHTGDRFVYPRFRATQSGEPPETAMPWGPGAAAAHPRIARVLGPLDAHNAPGPRSKHRVSTPRPRGTYLQGER